MKQHNLIRVKLLTMCLIKFSKYRMINPNGMDELFWGKDMEDVFDSTERLHMVGEVQKLDEEKLFKIAKLKLKGGLGLLLLA